MQHIHSVEGDRGRNCGGGGAGEVGGAGVGGVGGAGVAAAQNPPSLKRASSLSRRMNFVQEVVKKAGDDVMAMLDDGSFDARLNECKDVRDLLKKKRCDFAEFINNIGGELVYVKSGSTGHTFCGTRRDDTRFAVKIVAYPKHEKYGRINDARRPENAELTMLKILSYFVVNNHTPHIILPVCTFNSPIKPFIKLHHLGIIKHQRYDNFVERYGKDYFYEQVSVLISEWANGGDLLDYLRRKLDSISAMQWRVIMFQILSVLAVIHTKYPSFRHNDLKANNILINFHDDPPNCQYRYRVNDKVFKTPNIGFMTCIWDFDFASIDGLVENSKVNASWTNRLNVSTKRNQYYDIVFFLNSLLSPDFLPNYEKLKRRRVIPREVVEFFERIVPPEYQIGSPKVSKKGRLLVDEEYITPDRILSEDPFMDPLRQK